MSRFEASPLADWFVAHVRAVRASDCRNEHCLHTDQCLHTLWSRLIVDPTFARTLRKRASLAAAKSGLSRSWAEDVAVDVVLRLREQLARDLTLGFDLARGAAAFDSWFGTILYRQALKSAQALLRQMPQATQALEVETPAKCASAGPQAICLATRMNRFPNTKKAIVHRLAKGDTLLKIAADLQLPYKRTRMLAAEIRHTLRLEFAVDA